MHYKFQQMLIEHFIGNTPLNEMNEMDWVICAS